MTNPHPTGPSVPNPRPRVDLSPFERRVLVLLANGDSTEEIAVELGYCERNIKYYIMRMKLKLNAKNRVHIVSRAYQEGILTCQ